MKLKLFLPAVVLWAFLGPACHKNPFNYNDLGGDSTIRGTLALYDTLTGAYVAYGVSPTPVYLRYPTDTTGFLYSTTTNGLGQYTFNGIDATRSYIVFATKDSLQIIFYGQTLYPADSTGLYDADTLKLYPAQTNQNGLFIRLQDSLGGPLANAKLFVFSSQALWDNDDSIGSVYALTSDAYGRCLQMNIAPGEYYVHAKAQFGNLILAGSASYPVQRQGIESAPLTLHSGAAPYGTGFVYYLQDSTGDPLANGRLYVYTSRVLWNNYDSVGGSVYVLTSDAYGKCLLQGILPGEYYATAYDSVSNLILTASDSVAVVSDSLSTVYLPLKSQ